MSPTSYQAAPPRVSESNIAPQHTRSRLVSASTRVPISCCKAIQNLVVSLNESEFFARDPLVYLGILLYCLLHIPERIDVALQRVDRRRQLCMSRSLSQQIPRPELAPLNDEDQRGDRECGKQETAAQGGESKGCRAERKKGELRSAKRTTQLTCVRLRATLSHESVR